MVLENVSQVDTATNVSLMLISDFSFENHVYVKHHNTQSLPGGASSPYLGIFFPIYFSTRLLAFYLP